MHLRNSNAGPFNIALLGAQVRREGCKLHSQAETSEPTALAVEVGVVVNPAGCGAGAPSETAGEGKHGAEKRFSVPGTMLLERGLPCYRGAW